MLGPAIDRGSITSVHVIMPGEIGSRQIRRTQLAAAGLLLVTPASGSPTSSDLELPNF